MNKFSVKGGIRWAIGVGKGFLDELAFMQDNERVKCFKGGVSLSKRHRSIAVGLSAPFV